MIKIAILSLMLTACQLGDIDLNAPNLDANYEGRTVSAYKAILDGQQVFYIVDKYVCTLGFIYRSVDLLPILNTDTLPVQCEVSPYTYIAVTNTAGSLIE